MAGHGDLGAIREYIAGHIFKTLYKAKNIIPATALQPRHMISQFIENFIDLEGGHNGFDQNRGLDGSLGYTHHFLGLK